MQQAGTGMVVAFALATIAQLASSITLACWPVRGWLAGGTTLRQLLQLYTPTDSNLDVALLVTLQCVVFSVLVACTTPAPRGVAYDGIRRPFSTVCVFYCLRMYFFFF